MIDLTHLGQIKGLQANLRAVFGTPQGQEVMKFLEGFCGWYDFKATDPDLILIAHGKRQVLASLKTLLALSAEQVQQLSKEN